MTNIFTNPPSDDSAVRERMYGGDLFLYSARASSVALGDHARQMIKEAFGDLDPKTAQFHMPVEQYVSIVGPLKPKFIHDPKTRGLIQKMMEEFGCDLEKTYIDVPRLRMVTSDAYLTTGVGFAHHAHRDTWYSAPMQQLNWWLPLYDITPDNTIAFHPYYWDHPLKNGSDRFNYYEWNAQRATAAKHIKSDTRFQPMPEEPLDHADPHIRTIVEPNGVVLFAGAQLHSTIPNTSGVTRYSIDFRTVNIDDVLSKRSSPNLDSFPKGIALRDFVRASDYAPMPDEAVQLYETEAPTSGVLVYKPEASK